jgi:uncharacterized membrane protein (TIGR02234 family)
VVALAGGLVLVAFSRPWASVVPSVEGIPLPGRDLTGSDLYPAAGSLGVVLLVGAVAVVAARGWLRALVGVLLSLAGLGVAAVAVEFGRGAADPAVSAALSGAEAASISTSAWWALGLVAGVAAVVAGVITAGRGRSWPSLSTRYERPRAPAGPRVEEGPLPPGQVWDALDRGEDPTA